MCVLLIDMLHPQCIVLYYLNICIWCTQLVSKHGQAERTYNLINIQVSDYVYVASVFMHLRSLYCISVYKHYDIRRNICQDLPPLHFLHDQHSCNMMDPHTVENIAKGSGVHIQIQDNQEYTRFPCISEKYLADFGDISTSDHTEWHSLPIHIHRDIPLELEIKTVTTRNL